MRAARDALARLEIVNDLDGADRVWSDALALALANGVGLYDAIYLELALRAPLPLAGFDEALGAAAERLGLDWAH